MVHMIERSNKCRINTKSLSARFLLTIHGLPVGPYLVTVKELILP